VGSNPASNTKFRIVVDGLEHRCPRPFLLARQRFDQTGSEAAAESHEAILRRYQADL
jgi:hypothetical protein